MLTLLKIDLNFDGQVDITDVVTAATAFGSHPKHPEWDPAADLNSDNTVDILDVVLLAKNFGKTA